MTIPPLDDGQLFALLGSPSDDDHEATIGLAAIRRRLFGVDTAPVSLGKFELRGVLGEGAMGKVYRAWSPTLRCERALKLLHVDGDDADEIRERLLAEARAMARVKHPNVVQIHDADVSGEHDFYIEMDLVEGVTLRQWQREYATGWQAVVARYVEAGRGLAAVHAAGLVHGDFKADNVLVRSEHPVAMVSDFGLARGLHGERLADGSYVSYGGTPHYAAPEVLLRRHCDARSDQFSFCVALFEALTGSLPFARSFEELRSTADAEPEETSRVRHILELQSGARAGAIAWTPKARRLPSWLREALERGLQRDPKRRFASMGALVDAIDVDRRRRRTRTIGALALLGLSVTGAAGSAWWSNRQAESARREYQERLAPCRQGYKLIDEVWSTTTRDEIRSRIDKYSFDRLDEFAIEWGLTHDKICQEGTIDRSLTPEVQAVRKGCLDVSKAELASTVEILRRDPLQALPPELVAGLQPIARCGAQLDAIIPPSREQAAAVKATRELVARARVLEIAQDFDEAHAAINEAYNRALEIGYQPLIAESRYQHGRVGLQDALRRADEEQRSQIVIRFADLRDAIMSAQHDVQLARDAVLFALKTQARLESAGDPAEVDWLVAAEQDLRRSQIGLSVQDKAHLDMTDAIREYNAGKDCKDSDTGRIHSLKIDRLQAARRLAESAVGKFDSEANLVDEAKARRNLGDILLRLAECGERSFLENAILEFILSRGIWMAISDNRSSSNMIAVTERLAAALSLAGRSEGADELRRETTPLLLSPGRCFGEIGNALLERCEDASTTDSEALAYSKRALDCYLLPSKRIEALYLVLSLTLAPSTGRPDPSSEEVATLTGFAEEMLVLSEKEDASTYVLHAHAFRADLALRQGDCETAKRHIAAIADADLPPDAKATLLTDLGKRLRAQCS